MLFSFIQLEDYLLLWFDEALKSEVDLVNSHYVVSVQSPSIINQFKLIGVVQIILLIHIDGVVQELIDTDRIRGQNRRIRLRCQLLDLLLHILEALYRENLLKEFFKTVIRSW